MFIKSKKLSLGFTLAELAIVIAIIGILAAIAVVASGTVQKSSRDNVRQAKVTTISEALEKYYRENNEYPSVAAMTDANIDNVKAKLGLPDGELLKMPGSTANNSIAVTGASATTIVYSANTSDAAQNSQCQNVVNGYCDGYTLAYVNENDGATQTIQSANSTFAAVRSECSPGDTQSGNTCTHSYPGTYQAGAYSCPSGGTLSGTTCTRTYAANYNSGGTYYYCNDGATISGTTCYKSSATSSYYSCPNGGTQSGSTCTTSASSSTTYTCPNGGSPRPNSGQVFCHKSRNSTTTTACPHPSNDSDYGANKCRHDRSGYGTQAGCQNAGYTWSGGACFEIHDKTTTTTYSCDSGWGEMYFDMDPTPYCVQSAQSGTSYSCPSGWTVSGSNCTQSATVNEYCPSMSGYSVSQSGSNCTYSRAADSGSSSPYYYCNGSDSLNGTTCTNTYTATQSSGYYTCPQGGVANGSTCSYTYQIN